MNKIAELEAKLTKVQVQLKAATLISGEATTTTKPEEKTKARSQSNAGLLDNNNASTVSGFIGSIFGTKQPEIPQVVAAPIKKISAGTHLPNTKKVQRNHSSQVNSIRFSENNEYLAIGCMDKKVRFFSTNNFEDLPIDVTPADTVMNIQFSKNSQMAIATCVNGNCHLWALPSGKVRFELSGHTNKVCAADFTSDSMRLATGGYDRTVRVYDVIKGDLLKSIGSTIVSSVNNLEISELSDILVTAHQDGQVRFHDVRNYKFIHNIKAFVDAPATSVNISRNCHYLLAASNKELKLYDFRMYTEICSFTYVVTICF